MNCTSKSYHHKLVFKDIIISDSAKREMEDLEQELKYHFIEHLEKMHRMLISAIKKDKGAIRN
jgi:predicted protein tyrosine phosphatase